MQKVKSLLKKLPGLGGLASTDAWRLLRHRLVLYTGERENSTFTGFLRLPAQFDALAGPVLDYLLEGKKAGPLKIGVLGCSNGSEAYTIASVLKGSRPGLKFTINAFDIDRKMIEKGAGASYRREEIYNNRVITDSFIRKTFDMEKDTFTIKKGIRSHLKFDYADALDNRLKETVGPCDVVFAQNFIFHMKRDAARRALNNICALLNPRAALFVDGIDIDIRRRLTKRHNLAPLTYKIEEIHNEARMARAIGWPYSYWGLEPFLTTRRDWQRRYATVFLK